MSFCPTRDIHSIYLDNEMPEIYKAEYESHLTECEKCRHELEKLKKLKGLFQSDLSSITPDSVYLDQSFERLKIKQKYRRTVSKNERKTVNVRYFVPAVAAAAAAVFAIVLPFNKTAKNSIPNAPVAFASMGSQNMGIMPSASEVSLVNRNPKVISGNIRPSRITPVSADFVQNKNFEKKFNRDMDFFRPQFNDEDKMISIKITVPGPGINSIPVTTEIELPVNKLTGNFQ